MSSREAQLAAQARRVQWMLDQAAFDLPEGRCHAQRRAHLASVLDELAAALREEHTPLIVDAMPVSRNVARAILSSPTQRHPGGRRHE